MIWSTHWPIVRGISESSANAVLIAAHERETERDASPTDRKQASKHIMACTDTTQDVLNALHVADGDATTITLNYGAYMN